jgi:hypothetical protein
LKAPVLKTGRRASVSRVRIPPHPPINALMADALPVGASTSQQWQGWPSRGRPSFISTLDPMALLGVGATSRAAIDSKESYHEPTICCACLDRGAFDSGPCHAGGTSRRSSSGPAPFRTEAEPGPGEPDERSILAALPLLIVHGQQLRVRLLARCAFR